MLTFGQVIARAVRELDRPAVFQAAHEPLRHLIVDEYQDVNPAQEALIARLAEPPTQLCVVGDDDQAIYQWRGSTVENIVAFETRYPAVRQFKIQVNRRSRPAIIEHANRLSSLIEGRLDKAMQPHRDASEAVEVVCWSQPTVADEARLLAETIRDAHDNCGYRYRDVAILCRGRVSLPPILAALQEMNVPVKPGDRTNLFLQPEARLFGVTVCWLVDRGWRDDYQPEQHTTDGELVACYRSLFDLEPARLGALRQRLQGWKLQASDESKPANLVREWYDCSAISASRIGTCPTPGRSVAWEHWLAVLRCLPTTRRHGGVHGPIAMLQASRGAPEIVARPTTAGLLPTCRTGRRVPTKGLKARRPSILMPSI